MLEVVLYALLCALASLLIAGALKHRVQTALGALLGLLPGGAMQPPFLSLQASTRDCLEQACATAGLPPGCERFDTGCTEWSGLSQLLLGVSGLTAPVFDGIGAAVVAVRESRRPTGEGPWARRAATQDGPRVG